MFPSTNPLALSDLALQHLFHGHSFPLNAVPLQDFASLHIGAIALIPPGFWCVLLVPSNRSESNRLNRQYVIMKIWKSDLSAVCLGVSPYFLSFLVIAPKKRIIQQVDLWMPVMSCHRPKGPAHQA